MNHDKSITQVWVDTGNSPLSIAVVEFYPAIKAWPAGRMRTMTRSDLTATTASRFSNLMAKEGEIAVPVFEKPVPYFPVGKDLRERVEASAKHTPLQPAPSDVAE